jgi:hypothetical protein
MSAEKWQPMTDEQRERWKATGLFPVERWGFGNEDATPLVCPMPDRALLRKLAEGVPAHVQSSGWYASRQRDGMRSVYADNFRGMGRQAIASICSDSGRYFWTLADYIAAACPRTTLRLLDRIEELEARLARHEPPAAVIPPL